MNPGKDAMPATIEALLRRRDLGLTLLTPDTLPSTGDAPAIRTPIRWVATSELPDPTPFLRGGELLLTTGMRLPRDARAARDYVARLVAVGVVGLGLGIGAGLAFRTVPPRLVHAAEEHGLALLLVDEPTPFIAIGEAVAQMHLADETAALARAVAAQQSLTRAAVLRGRTGIADQLASLTGGWIVVTDPAGGVIAEAGSGTAPAAVWRGELDRMRASGVGSAAVAEPGSYISIHALGDGRLTRGFLVTGRSHQPRSEHAVTAVAAALLTLGWGDGRNAPWADEPTNLPTATPGILAPLLRLPRPRTRDTLLATLRTWLTLNGNYDATARDLGVHRNTVRYRIGRIAEILDRNMGDAAVRAELWLALGLPELRHAELRHPDGSGTGAS